VHEKFPVNELRKNKLPENQKSPNDRWPYGTPFRHWNPSNRLRSPTVEAIDRAVAANVKPSTGDPSTPANNSGHRALSHRAGLRARPGVSGSIEMDSRGQLVRVGDKLATGIRCRSKLCRGRNALTAGRARSPLVLIHADRHTHC